MSKTMYDASWSYQPSIKAVEIEAETEHFVTPKGFRRRAKQTPYGGFYATWEEAYEAVFAHYERQVAAARIALQRAHDALGNAKGLKKPKEQA
jgi:hypothetical protein